MIRKPIGQTRKQTNRQTHLNVVIEVIIYKINLCLDASSIPHNFSINIDSN